MFKKNLGLSGRLLRFILGVLLLIYAIWQESWIALGFSLFTLFESLMSWCVIYQLIGKNECPIDQEKPKN